MKLRTLFALLLLTLALPAGLAAEAPSAPPTAAPGAAAPAVTGPDTAPVSPLLIEVQEPAPQEVRPEADLALSPAPLVEVWEPAPQDGFQGCPFADVFSFGAPSEACFDEAAGCASLCAQNGGTLIAGVTSTGADCTCVCCRD